MKRFSVMPSRFFGAAQFSAHGQNTRGVGHLQGEAGDYWRHPPATPNREPSSPARRGGRSIGGGGRKLSGPPPPPLPTASPRARLGESDSKTPVRNWFLTSPTF